MAEQETIELTREQARSLMLAAQGVLHGPVGAPDLDALQATIDRLGVVQIDTISVVERSQYLVLWSRLGAYEPTQLDTLLYPRRAIMEYWSHAASIVPMADYPYYRRSMLDYREHMWNGHVAWMADNPQVLHETLAAVEVRGPVASADFERDPNGGRTGPWDWHGPKASRRALEVLWTIGDLMVHSRRGGQKLYDLRARVLAQAFGDAVPRDEHLPGPDERRRYLALRTVRALGVVTPSWLWDYFRLAPPAGATKRAAGLALLREFAGEGLVRPATVAGLDEPAFVDATVVPELDRVLQGATMRHTTLLSPFDNLIWDRARARALWDYEVCFEAYVPPPKRRYGYYCLAILHQGKLVGRLDPKMDRATGRLLVRAVYLEPGVRVSDHLLTGLAASLCDLARFLGGQAAVVDENVGGHQVLGRALEERLRL